MVQILPDLKLNFDDVLILPKRSSLTSRSDVKLEREYNFLNSDNCFFGIPIIAANMDTIGTYKMAVALAKFNMPTALHKHYTNEDSSLFFGVDPQRFKHTWISLGMTDKDYDRLKKLLYAFDETNEYPNICIDVANGYQQSFVEFVRRIRNDFGTRCTIMAGNVVTKEMTEALLIAGADIVKVGIGPGSVCMTRTMTGVGYPQLSAILECADAAHGLGGHICADGGCRTPADVAKAFAAGADFVMLGGMLAGHDECDGKIINPKINHEDYPELDPFVISEQNAALPPAMMKFYGMSSQDAMDKHYGGKAAYRAAEGKTVEVPYKGPVSNTIETILGGIRSTCTYTGSKTLKELTKRATLVRVTQQKNDVFGTD